MNVDVYHDGEVFEPLKVEITITSQQELHALRAICRDDDDSVATGGDSFQSTRRLFLRKMLKLIKEKLPAEEYDNLWERKWDYGEM